MPRLIPADRLGALIEAGTAVFVAQGYRRAQMQDVADALGVAKGTVNGAVAGKDALLLACIRYADGLAPLPAAVVLTQGLTSAMSSWVHAAIGEGARGPRHRGGRGLVVASLAWAAVFTSLERVLAGSGVYEQLHPDPLVAGRARARG